VKTQYTKVESSLNLHYNQVNSPSEEEALVSNDGYEKIDSLTLYIPDSINLDRILEQNPPDFKYHKDCFVYILSLITSIPSNRRELIDDNHGFTPINKKILQMRIKNYREHINYLISMRIVEENSFYIPGKVSKGLKFCDNYNTRIAPVEITKWTLIKSILYLNWEYNEERTEELSSLKKWFNDKLQVDFVNGSNYLYQEYLKDVNDDEVKYPELTFNSRLLPLQKLYRKEYSFYVDDTGYRLHTGLTQLKSELRNYLKYAGKTLCSIDITNSQPYLAIALLDKEAFIRNDIHTYITNPNLTSLPSFPNMVVKIIEENENKEDVLLFKELVSKGEFYEGFGKVLMDNGLIDKKTLNEARNEAKEIAFSSIYSPNRHIGSNEAIQLFKSQFPNVFEVFKLIKKGAKCHNTLSIALQRFEAEVVLHKTCKLISIERPEIPLFTIHDSIITTEENVEFVENKLSEVLFQCIGFKPSLKKESWN
tara:strand:- start:417 stop:1856 length:1440 start_codon:yes stop_codon:yes gene_type:complete